MGAKRVLPVKLLDIHRPLVEMHAAKDSSLLRPVQLLAETRRAWLQIAGGTHEIELCGQEHWKRRSALHGRII
jgi:hypothetical protein